MAASHPIPDPASPVPLSDLAPGASAVVVRVEATRIGRRLLDLGFVPDTAIRVVRRAPLGDPTTYELRGTRLCLRRSEARAVLVTPRPTAGAGR
jgi:ferrous iron transport protein A